MKDPLEEAGSDVTRRGAGISLLLVLLGLILLAILRPSTIDTLAIIFGIVALIMLHEAGHYFTAKRAGMKCVAIASTFPFEELEKQTRADLTVTSFEEVNLERLRLLVKDAPRPAGSS